MSVKLVGKDAGRYQFASFASSVRSIRSSARGFNLSGGMGRHGAASDGSAEGSLFDGRLGEPFGDRVGQARERANAWDARRRFHQFQWRIG